MANLVDNEVISTCFVLRRMLQKTLQEAVSIIQNPAQWEVEDLARSRFLAVVLTSGLLENAAFASLLTKAVQCVECLPVSVQASFAYPDNNFWANLGSGKVLNPEDKLLGGASLSDVTASYKTLFETLAS